MRHQGDELRRDREMREVRHFDARVAELRKNPCHFLMRQLQEVLKPAELFHHSQRRGMDRVAAKIAEEILVLLEHRTLTPARARSTPSIIPAGPPPAMQHVTR